MSLSSVVSELRAAGCVFAEDEARLILATAKSPAELRRMVGERVAGLPLEHVLGWARFRGLCVLVDPGVFVPRRRTEFLAGEAIARARPGSVVVDLCCGTGAVGAAVAAEVPGVLLYATDIDPAAVACARRNLPEARIQQGDLYQALPLCLRGRIDVLVANCPYVPTEEVDLLPPEARLHEPLVALDGGEDGLELIRRVIRLAPEWLAPGGSVLVETSDEQAASACTALLKAGLEPSITSSEELDATVIVGQMPIR
ncbi:putative protein N(5)-glutamine methyltransferase [Herbidospora cretacea]|uniref:putative protein N(5)-glutamine methyltransferase n=1 Tax=Herbidospora cretacea TaxID=28444 RepID=UPI000772D878|nr:putative protein N(5)-glutamine methyltransferase [Herbidospora cretacea]